jgi:putative tryptophan/tyrosine transport system substrate-binding protein
MQGSELRRRQFLALLVNAALVGWSSVADAQQAKLRRLGALILGNADAQSFRQELLAELGKSGLIDGKNLVLELRSAEGNIGTLPKLAAELVALKVDVIVALFTPCALAAQQATGQIPIVVVTADPIGSGLVSSLARPGGNITGVSLMASELHGKCVELFRDMLPSLKRIAFLSNAADPSWRAILEQVQLAGKIANIEITPVVTVRGLQEIDAAFETMSRQRADAVVIQGSLSTKAVAEAAVKYRLPAATVPRSFAEAGGLMSYGTVGPEIFRRSAAFVIKILDGSRPADLPVEQPTKFELIVNLKAAKAIGLTIPPSFLLRADEVIE